MLTSTRGAGKSTVPERTEKEGEVVVKLPVSKVALMVR
jgi:hypothetical protein